MVKLSYMIIFMVHSRRYALSYTQWFIDFLFIARDSI